jgi:Tfp pilus assembly protein PilV
MTAWQRTLYGKILSVYKNSGDARGLSLVEVLVSAVFVALSVVAVISSASTGVRLQVSDNDRRQARAIMQSVLEDRYDFRSYPTIVSNTTRTETVTIDSRGGNPLQGEMKTVVTDVAPITDNGCTFSAKQVTISCKWNEDQNTQDSIQLTKTIAQAQP